MKNMSRYEIHGVTDGIAARPFIVRIFGKFDAKHGQICREEDKFTSPWILGKKSCCEDFINASYIEAAKKMEKAHRDVIVAVRRLREIEIEKPFPRFAFNEEQRARHEMEEERKEQNNRTEQVNLRMRMAEATCTAMYRMRRKSVERKEESYRVLPLARYSATSICTD